MNRSGERRCLTTTVASDFIVAGVGGNHNACTFTATAGFTIASQSNGSNAIAISTGGTTAAGTYSPGVNITGGSDNAPMGAVAFFTTAAPPPNDTTNWLAIASGAIFNPMTTEGDTIYGGPSSVPSRLPAGASGDFLQTQGSGLPTVWSPGGGGRGGGLFAGLIGTTPTIAAAGLTTAFNQSVTFSAVNSAIGISMADTAASSTEHIEGVVQTYPGVPYTLTVCMSMPIFASDYNLTGIMAATSTSGKIMFFGIRWNAPWQFAVLNYTAYNSYCSTPYGYTSYSQAPYIWLRLKDDGTSIYFSVSNDGIYFNQLYTVTKASSFLGSSGFGLLGLGIDPCNGVMGSTCMVYNYTTP